MRALILAVLFPLIAGADEIPVREVWQLTEDKISTDQPAGHICMYEHLNGTGRLVLWMLDHCVFVFGVVED